MKVATGFGRKHVGRMDEDGYICYLMDRKKDMIIFVVTARF